MVSYKTTSILAGSLSVILSLLLMFAPTVIYAIFEMAAHDSTNILARRAASLFAAFAIIALVGRNEPDTPMRRAVAMGGSGMMALLIIVGIYEFMRGAVGYGIGLAIATELFLVICYVPFWKKEDA